MADAVVEFLLDNLKQLLLYNADLISGVKGQVESLYKELSLMKAFLKDSKEKPSEYEYVRELVRQIRDVAYEAEDIIDMFVVNAAMQKERSTFSKMVHVFDHPSKLRSVAKDIESIKVKVKEIYEKKKFGIEALYAGESSKKPTSLKRRKPDVEEDNVIGFDEEAREVVSRLTNISESLEVVSVVGMGGLGKTTLAKKVYCDPAVEFHFFVRGWVYVSQEYNRKEVLFAILGSITQPSDHTSKMSEEMIIQEICKHLNGRRYLVVLDDVWTTNAWNDLKSAFPNHDCGSRILLTTRNTDVALLASPYTSPHQLRFLNEDESFKLLSTKVFRKGSCPFELVELGKTIAKKCDGLPLALVVIAGLLLKKDKTRDLRYISIFGNFKVLPPSIAKLWSLQSLVVETTARELDIQVDIWKMSQFRHLRTNGSSHLHGPQAKTRMDNEDPFVQGNIQTISTISPDSCTENILARTPNLKKLGIRGRLVVLMELKKNASLFANLAKLDNLEKLKLLNDTFPRPPSEGKLRALPPSYKFPPHLNKLTLSDTLLDWKHMSTIAMLPYLEVLKLKVYAFTGPQWDPLDGGFRLLKYLLIGKTDLVHWNASGHHFPRLEHIVVEQCCDLEALPHGLKDLSTLRTMELHHTPSAIRSARLIEGHKKMQSNAFKLLIYPPESD